MSSPARQAGYTLVELLVAVALCAMLVAAASRMVVSANRVEAQLSARAQAQRSLSFAFQRIQLALRDETTLLLPLADDPDSDDDEGIREQFFPAQGDKTAVLAVRLGATIDRDQDGIADADNDGDGRVDEDVTWDMTNDDENGIIGIDDDNDGSVDEQSFGADGDDDERYYFYNEDPLDGIDNDGDGGIDEDLPGDMNGDGAPGVAGVDDDGDGSIDEGATEDDDEDGQSGEDWIDAVVFLMRDDALIERTPVSWDASGDGDVDGRDFIEETLISGVTYLRFARQAGGRSNWVDVTLEVTDADGQAQRLQSALRVGVGL